MFTTMESIPAFVGRKNMPWTPVHNSWEHANSNFQAVIHVDQCNLDLFIETQANKFGWQWTLFICYCINSTWDDKCPDYNSQPPVAKLPESTCHKNDQKGQKESSEKMANGPFLSEVLSCPPFLVWDCWELSWTTSLHCWLWLFSLCVLSGWIFHNWGGEVWCCETQWRNPFCQIGDNPLRFNAKIILPPSLFSQFSAPYLCSNEFHILVLPLGVVLLVLLLVAIAIAGEMSSSIWTQLEHLFFFTHCKCSSAFLILVRE